MSKLLTSLPDSGRTIVYQTIVDHLKADATLSVVIPASQWTTYTEANPTVRNSPTENNGLPAIRLMPFAAALATQEAQVLQNSPFGIAVALTTSGLDVRDILNLWGAFERSLFPGDGSKTLNNTIRAALEAASIAQGGKNIGSLQTINLSLPAVGPSTDSGKSTGFMTAEGTIVAMMTVPK